MGPCAPTVWVRRKAPHDWAHGKNRYPLPIYVETNIVGFMETEEYEARVADIKAVNLIPGNAAFTDFIEHLNEIQVRFPDADIWELGHAIESNPGSLPDDFDRRLVKRVDLIQRGENEELDWIWTVLFEDGTAAEFRGGCDFTGWDCQSDLHFEWIG